MPRNIVKGKPKCGRCSKEVETFEIIRFTDLKGWCSDECFYKDADEEAEREAKYKEHKRIQGIMT